MTCKLSTMAIAAMLSATAIHGAGAQVLEQAPAPVSTLDNTPPAATAAPAPPAPAPVTTDVPRPALLPNTTETKPAKTKSMDATSTATKSTGTKPAVAGTTEDVPRRHRMRRHHWRFAGYGIYRARYFPSIYWPRRHWPRFSWHRFGLPFRF